MKKIIYSLFIILYYTCHITGHAQNAEESILALKPQFYSPQVADLIRYDHTPIALNSGRVDLQIPALNSFFDRDFNFPISLSYNSSGFKPSEPEGNLGLHWSLVMGGVIYREVRGIPDDTDSQTLTNISNKLSVRGFLHLNKNKYNTKTTSKLIFDEPKNYIDHNYYYNFALIKNCNNIEASSDIYRFNFGGHSGKFVIDFDGSVKSVSHSGGKVQVDLSKFLLTQSVQDNECGKSEIKITTDDGYIYCFGGSYSAMEYTAFSWDERLTYSDQEGKNPSPQNVNDVTRNNTITAFHLYKIIAPNGRILKINYKNTVDTHSSPQDIGTYHVLPWDLFNYPNDNNNRDLQMCYLLRQSKYGYGRKIYENLTLNKIALIESVELDDKLVKFHHSSLSSTMYDTVKTSQNFIFGFKTGAKLDSISLYAKKGNVLDRIESSQFQYKQIEKRRFLSEIRNSINGIYKLDYDISGAGVSPLSIDYDHWGYWNGEGTNTGLVPNVDYNGIPLLHLTLGDRRTGKSVANATLLSKIIYPTGGYNEFKYESHECLYGLSLYLRTMGITIPSMLSHGNTKIGGSRVKQVVISSDGKERTKDYIYADFPINADGNYKSSGELMYIPIYRSYWTNSSIFLQTYSSFGLNERPYDSDHVRYYSVLEYDNLKKKHIVIGNSTDHVGIAPSDPKRIVEKRVKTYNVPQEWTISGSEKGKYLGQQGTALVYIIEETESHRIVKYSLPFAINSYFRGYHGDPIFGEKESDRRIRLEANCEYIIKIECYGEPDMMTGSWAAVNITYYDGKKYDVITHDQYKQTIFTNYGNDLIPGHSDNYNDDKLYPNDYIPIVFEDEMVDYAYQSITKKPQDRSIERGKMKEEKFYSKEGDLVKHIIYEYRKVDSEALNNYSIYINTPTAVINTNLGYYSQINKEYFYTFYPISKTIKDYSNRYNPIELKENYTYDKEGNYIKEKIIINSDKNIIKNNYSYAFDKENDIYKEMTRKNVISPILETKVTTGNSTKLTRINYFKDIQRTNNLIVPESVTTIINTNERNDITFSRYDSFGRLLEAISLDGLSTIYLWSYSGQYPIAEIRGATYNQVETAVKAEFGVTNIDALSKLAAPDVAKLQKLRLNKNLSGAHVTTYTYQPLIGMTTVTDPTGVTVTYEYDPFGRLKRTKDQNGKTIQEYDYHYRNQ